MSDDGASPMQSPFQTMTLKGGCAPERRIRSLDTKWWCHLVAHSLSDLWGDLGSLPSALWALQATGPKGRAPLLVDKARFLLKFKLWLPPMHFSSLSPGTLVALSWQG